MYKGGYVVIGDHRHTETFKKEVAGAIDKRVWVIGNKEESCINLKTILYMLLCDP